MAKPKLKIKKSKNLPKFTIGGEESNIYVNQVGNDKPFISSVSSSDPFGTQKDLQGSSLTKSQQPLMFAGQAPKSSGLNIDAGRFFNNTASDSQASASAGTSGASQANKMNNVAGYAQMAGGAARAISAGSNRRDPEDFRSKQIAQEDAVMGAVGQIGPVGGVIAGAYNVGQSIGDPIRQSAEAENKQAAEKGEYKLADKNEAASMAVVGGIFDPIKTIQARSSYSGGWTDLSGQGYAKHLEQKGQERLDELNRPKREAEMADMRNKLNYGTFRQGGINYPTNAIPMHGNQGAWAVPLFANGGKTFQVDGPSHEQGGVVIPTPNGDYYEVEKQEVIKRESNADKILSDKLKDKESGKTYALAQKPYEKLKEQVAKFKSDSAKAATEEYASQNFDKLYNRQEMEKSLKQKLQLERDFFKCGGMVKYKNGGIHIKPENRGKFTAAANRAGMGVQEYANHILAHKDNYSSTLVKRANFAHNAAGWKHEDGGIQQFGDGGKKYDSFTQASIDRNKKDLEEYHDAMLKSEFQKNFGNSGSSYNPSIFLMSNYKYLPYNDSLKYSDSAPYYRQLMNGVLKVNEIYDKPNKHKNGGYQPLDNPYKHVHNIPAFEFGGEKDGLKPTGYNLMANVKLNQDPTLIPKGANTGGYNAFQKFLSGKDFVKNPLMNTNEGRKQYTDQLINEFNNSEYVQKYPQNKITPESIKAVQQYHKLSDPNVVVDGWVGSQTSQMRYPTSSLTYQRKSATDNTPAYLDKPIDVQWGNKKYTLPANKWNNYTTKDFIPSNKYGGVQKFTKGGEKTDLPTVEEEDLKLYTLEEAANNAFWRNQYPQYFNTPTNNRSVNVNPNNPYAGTFNFNMPVGGPLDQAILRDRNQSYASDGIPANAGPASSPNVPSNVTQNQQETSPANKAEGQPSGHNNLNWKEGAYQLGTGLANNIGEIYAMFKASDPVEVQKRYDYTPKLLNNTAAERAAWRMYKNTADSLKSAGLSSGQYVSNLGANRARLTEQLDESRINRENVNAGIENQAQQYNIAGKYSVDDINARNRAAKENIQLKATERMGTNIAQQSKDYRSTQQEKQMLPFLQKAFSDPAFQQMFAKWMASQGVG